MPLNTEPDDLYPPVVDGKCNAKLRASGNRPRRRCRKDAGEGTDHVKFGHCKFHGGSTPNQRKGSSREMYAVEFAGRVSFGEELPIDPLLGLVTEVARTNGFIAYLQERISDRTDEDGDVVLMEDDDVGGQHVHPLMMLWRAERAHFTKLCKMTVDAGIEQKTLDLVTAYQTRVLDLIEGLLTELGHDANDPAVDAVVTRHLALITAKGVA